MITRGERPMDRRRLLVPGKLGGPQFLFGAPLIIGPVVLTHDTPFRNKHLRYGDLMQDPWRVFNMS